MASSRVLCGSLVLAGSEIVQIAVVGGSVKLSDTGGSAAIYTQEKSLPVREFDVALGGQLREAVSVQSPPLRIGIEPSTDSVLST